MSLNWKLIASGNKEAFIELYKCQYDALFCYGLSLTLDREITKDCIQEMFTEFWKKKATINNEVINERSYLFTWLRRIIRKELEKMGRERSLPVSEIAGSQASYEELLVTIQQSEEKRNELRTALRKLTKKQLEIVRLRFYEKLSCQQIADRLSLSTRTVYNTIYEALHHLRQTMGVLNLHPIF